VLSNPVYTTEYVERIAPRHLPPARLHQRAALATIRALRAAFDWWTGYRHAPSTMTEDKWLTRMLFLETVAGVPGMVGGVLRHLKSLRLMRADQGWINTLLAEAENEV
jgi:threonyl-tRNA synthetase